MTHRLDRHTTQFTSTCHAQHKHTDHVCTDTDMQATTQCDCAHTCTQRPTDLHRQALPAQVTHSGGQQEPGRAPPSGSANGGCKKTGSSGLSSPSTLSSCMGPETLNFDLPVGRTGGQHSGPWAHCAGGRPVSLWGVCCRLSREVWARQAGRLTGEPAHRSAESG